MATVVVVSPSFRLRPDKSMVFWALGPSFVGAVAGLAEAGLWAQGDDIIPFRLHSSF